MENAVYNHVRSVDVHVGIIITTLYIKRICLLHVWVIRRNGEACEKISVSTEL